MEYLKCFIKLPFERPKKKSIPTPSPNRNVDGIQRQQRVAQDNRDDGSLIGEWRWVGGKCTAAN